MEKIIYLILSLIAFSFSFINTKQIKNKDLENLCYAITQYVLALWILNLMS